MMTVNYQTRIAQWNESAELLKSVRTLVFIDEQKVPESMEWDRQDETAIHALSTDTHGRAVATGRLLPNGQIGRMAVLPALRGKGLGSKVLSLLLQAAKQKGLSKVFLHSQKTAINFYEKHGFASCGEPFMEAGIAHQAMELDL